MNLPERNVALAWVGRTVVDRDGAEIGACTAVFADDATELAEWVCSEFDGSTVFIPAVGAAETDGMVKVVISRDDVAGAPPVGGPEHISGDEEVALYRHYGIPHSRDASPTVLPTEDAVPPGDSSGPAQAGTAETGSADSAIAPASAGTPDMVVTSESTTGPDLAPSRASEEREAPTSGRTPKRRGRIMAAAGGVSALAVAAGAVLQARRRRQRSMAARIARTTRIVRQRQAGAAVVTSALTGAVIAARRRRSRDTRQTADTGRIRDTGEIRDLRDAPTY
ncbi:MAG TPA: hypothetical protein VI357_24845 [Mycobacteriales bacterium]